MTFHGFESASRAIKANVETKRSKSEPGFGSLKTATCQGYLGSQWKLVTTQRRLLGLFRMYQNTPLEDRILISRVCVHWKPGLNPRGRFGKNLYQIYYPRR